MSTTFKFHKSIDDIEEPVLMDEDWYKLYISGKVEIKPNKKKTENPSQEGAGDNMVIPLRVHDDEGEHAGRMFTAYLPVPTEEDENKRDGIGMKISDAKMQRIVDAAVAFGGDEAAAGDSVEFIEGTVAYGRVTQQMDQRGERIINTLDVFAGFKNIENVETDEEASF